jgi:hypothetical protein
MTGGDGHVQNVFRSQKEESHEEKTQKEESREEKITWMNAAGDCRDKLQVTS